MGTRRRASSGRAMRGARDGARDAPEDARGGDAMESSRDALRAIREWEEEMGSNANATSSEKFSRNPLANATSEKCPVLGARTLFRDARTGAGLFYAPRFWDPDEGHAALRAQVAGDYLPRDDPTRHPRGSKRRATPGSARPGVLRRDVRREGRRDRTGRDGGIDARSIPLVGCRTGVDVDHEPLVGVVPVQPRSHASARAAFAAGHHTPSSGRGARRVRADVQSRRRESVQRRGRRHRRARG